MAMIDNININIEIAQHTSNLTLETNFLSSLSPIVAAVLEVEVSSVRNPTPAARRCQENPILKMAQHLWKKTERNIYTGTLGYTVGNIWKLRKSKKNSKRNKLAIIWPKCGCRQEALAGSVGVVAMAAALFEKQYGLPDHINKLKIQKKGQSKTNQSK